MKTCESCGQSVPQTFEPGDIVQTDTGRLALVPDQFLRELLDERYGGPVDSVNIRLIDLKAGWSFVASRNRVSIVHGFYSHPGA